MSAERDSRDQEISDIYRTAEHMLDKKDEVIAGLRAELTAERAKAAALVGALGAYMDAYPAFRSKPVGAPTSPARERQEQEIAREDRARAALTTSGVSLAATIARVLTADEANDTYALTRAIEALRLAWHATGPAEEAGR